MTDLMDRPCSHLLFLQGMPSRFFSLVGAELAARGCRVTGVNFCLGDWLFWNGPNTVNYRGQLAAWPAFIETFMRDQGVTDIVMVGDQRTYHKSAIEAARRCGVRIAVFDFGYLRPGWLTLEADGKNRNGRFPQDPVAVRQFAAACGAPEFESSCRDAFSDMAVRDVVYTFANVLVGWFFFPNYRRSDSRPHPLIYFPAMGRRLLLAPIAARRAVRRLAALIERRAPYFVFPLQLGHDFQIIAYSPYRSMADAIREVIVSFARHADARFHLAVKVHPWDPGLKNWERLVGRLAREAGIAHRVHYFDGGDLERLAAASRGMVTVNSTAGLNALRAHLPVKVLGEAIYNLPGLTHPGSLDTFWTSAARPDPVLVLALVRAIAATIQVRGGFFSEPGLSAAARESALRLLTRRVGAAPGTTPPGACAG